MSIKRVRLDKLAPHPVTVSLDDRTGVYVRSHKCMSCQLEYATFSWVEDRPTPFCPECGDAAMKLTETTKISDETRFTLGSPTEIYRLVSGLLSATSNHSRQSDAPSVPAPTN